MIDIEYDPEDEFIKIIFDEDNYKLIRLDEAYRLRRRLFDELSYTPKDLLIKKDMLKNEFLKGYQQAINDLNNNKNNYKEK